MSTGKGQEQTGHSKTPTEAYAVCNQFFFEDRKSPTMHELREAPSGTFTLLVPEATTKQLRALLKKEYDVSNMFSKQDLVAGLTAKRLDAVLLSSLGGIRHEAGCLDQELCECRPKLRFCKTCHNSLKNGRAQTVHREWQLHWKWS